MITLVPTEALLKAAGRCVWFESPETAMQDIPRLAAHILTFGTADDVKALRVQISKDDLLALLDCAPPGVFDARSWSYWNLMAGRYDAPPMPERLL